MLLLPAALRFLLAAKLRRSNIDAAAGTVAEMIRIVGQIRARWPRVRILLRADSGFCREALMHATIALRSLNAGVATRRCEANRVDFVFGLARNERLVAAIEAEWTQSEANPRFIVTSVAANQLRLWFASLAYVLICGLRRVGLAHTQFANATCGTIRLRLLKIGALVKISVRRVAVAMASACPWQHELALAHAMLRRAAA